MVSGFVTGYNRTNVHRLVLDMYIKHRLNTVGGTSVEIPNLKFFDKNRRHSEQSAIIDLTFPHFSFKRRPLSTHLPLTASKKVTVPLEAMLVYHNYAYSLKPVKSLLAKANESGLETATVLMEHLNYMYGINWIVEVEEDTRGKKVVPLFSNRVISKDQLLDKLSNAFKSVYHSEARFRMELRQESVEIDIAYIDSPNRMVGKEKILITAE